MHLGPVKQFSELPTEPCISRPVPTPLQPRTPARAKAPASAVGMSRVRYEAQRHSHPLGPRLVKVAVELVISSLSLTKCVTQSEAMACEAVRRRGLGEGINESAGAH
jgi:hypothetical protein